MRRSISLLLITVFVTLLAFAGTTLLAGYAGKQLPENRKAITLYTTLPVEQASLLTSDFERQNNVRVVIVPLIPSELLARLAAEKAAPQSDLILTDAEVLRDAKKQGLLSAYSSEQTDIVPSQFKDADGHWTGLWYDIFVFAVNKDTAKISSGDSLTWSDLAANGNRLAMTDFLAADAAARLLFTLTASMGDDKAMDYLGKLHPKIVQYAKFLSTPARMAGMGEADIAIAVQSEALRYVKDGFPIKLLYPQDGTAYVLTGAALTKPSAAPEAKQFLDWLLQTRAEQILIENRYYFIPVNPEVTIARSLFPASVKLLDTNETTADMRRKTLDRWVQTIRLSPKK